MSTKYWSAKEDTLLSEAVTSSKNKSKSLKRIFTEISFKLNRTPAACESRWNRHLKHLKKRQEIKEIYVREINQLLDQIEKDQNEMTNFDKDGLINEYNSIVEEKAKKAKRDQQLKENIEKISKFIDYDLKKTTLSDLPVLPSNKLIMETIKLLIELLEHSEKIKNKYV